MGREDGQPQTEAQEGGQEAGEESFQEAKSQMTIVLYILAAIGLFNLLLWAVFLFIMISASRKVVRFHKRDLDRREQSVSDMFRKF